MKILNKNVKGININGKKVKSITIFGKKESLVKETDITDTYLDRVWTRDDIGKRLKIWILGHEVKRTFPFAWEAHTLKIITKGISQSPMSEIFVDGTKTLSYKYRNDWDTITLNFILEDIKLDNTRFRIDDEYLGFGKFNYRFMDYITIQKDAITKVVLLEK